ncbi:LacI family DNA-binding transcriptional regulator [Actinoplanes sp. NPDC051470]|uniref:LacI family DNA-binding transcriptional regulator n=1 Tax=unclassified Actinoplanes TaxID=2626549 RepID=UPI00342B635A
MTKRRPAGTDVASRAGVSQKTVSRVMNGEPYVKEEVRLRVLQAAQELGYRRNNAARTLTSGRTRRIGVVSLGSPLYGPASTLIELERGARSTGYSLSVVTTFEGDPAGVAGAIESLLGEGVDGIVLSEPIDEGESVRVDADLPVLSLGNFPGLTGPGVVFSGADGAEAGRVATRHLLDLGHETVHHVAGPQRWWAARDRLAGWQQALQKKPPEWIEGDWSPKSGYAAGLRLAEDPGVTAVFVANDDMAIGLLAAMREAGRDVPGDVSVVGVDDIPSAAYQSPPLTTVRQDFVTMVRHGLDRLLRQIEAPGSATPGPPEPLHLVVRRSTARPR